MERLFSPHDVADNRYTRMAKVSGRIFEAIRRAIVRLQLRPGTLLSEVEVAGQFGVSKQPVREAFIKLEEAQLLEIRPQRGSYVRLISSSEVTDAHFLRTAIETALVRAAAECTSASEIAALRHIIADQRQHAMDDNNIGFLSLDEVFHQMLAKCAQRENTWRVLDNLKAQTDRVRFLSLPNATPLQTLIEQHEEIVDAIEQKDADRAEAAIKTHLSELKKSLPKLAAQYPELFSD